MTRFASIIALLLLCAGLAAIDQLVIDFMEVVNEIDSLAARCEFADTPQKQAKILFEYDKLMFQLRDRRLLLEKKYPDYRGENRPEGMLEDGEFMDRIAPAVLKIMYVGMDNLDHPVVGAAYKRIELNKDKWTAEE